MVAVGSCLIVAGGSRQTVEVLDTHRNRVWNLPSLGNDRFDCTMVAVANQVAVIGGGFNPTCATLPLLDKNSWCFRQLCEQQPNGWYHSLEGADIRDEDISPFFTSTRARQRARFDTHRGDKGTDEASTFCSQVINLFLRSFAILGPSNWLLKSRKNMLQDRRCLFVVDGVEGTTKFLCRYKW